MSTWFIITCVDFFAWCSHSREPIVESQQWNQFCSFWINGRTSVNLSTRLRKHIIFCFKFFSARLVLVVYDTVSMKEMKEMVTVYSMAISQSTEYPQMHLASFSRILFTTGWRFLVVSDCFGSGAEGWQIWLDFDLPSIRRSISSIGAEDFIIKYEFYCYFNTVFCGSVVVVENCHRFTTCP